MKTCTTTALLLASSVSARLYSTSPLISVGPRGSEPLFKTNLSDDAYQMAITNPRASHSIKFSPFPGIWRNQSDFRSDLEEWTWRVNVTYFAMPSEERENITEITRIEDPYHVSTTYDFQWPGGGNLSDAMNRSTEGPPHGPFCVTVSTNLMPKNVSDLYKAENANSTSCEPVLGEKCVKAILRHGSNVNFDNGCSKTGTSWARLPECQSTLGWARDAPDPRGRPMFYRGFATATANIMPDDRNSPNLTAAERNNTLSSGESFVGLHSGIVDGVNVTTDYLEAATRLQLMMISSTSGNTGRPQLLCMRVNTTVESAGNLLSAAGGQTLWTVVVAALVSFALTL
ncbi:hypothetical protein CPLU01_11212 [Colletotrichum plurivorum]|uniref:Uncharacterized protein n=1 Tax=Colletotrichum plurivorum TaxID=2175906 RepID=A0A8H6N8V8_9PEZI|nr:hypothetical protein CPLU01_11212 [Colletotrichum plurivorum]